MEIIEDYVLRILSRYHNCVLDKKIYKKYGKEKMQEELLKKGFLVDIQDIGGTIIAFLVN